MDKHPIVFQREYIAKKIKSSSQLSEPPFFTKRVDRERAVKVAFFQTYHFYIKPFTNKLFDPKNNKSQIIIVLMNLLSDEKKSYSFGHKSELSTFWAVV